MRDIHYFHLVWMDTRILFTWLLRVLCHFLLVKEKRTAVTDIACRVCKRKDTLTMFVDEPIAAGADQIVGRPSIGKRSLGLSAH